ncbi:mannose-6-phosphate isomerase, type 1 [Priestia flexa]|nr:mannose-6-phosphate isomerase, type 1 [Priestia flexa]
MIFGHHAKSKEEFIQMINEGHWDELLQRVKIKPGDFFYVLSGTIHALCKGTLVLETQQSSDTTYRVYDYERLGQDGQLRELHIDKAIEVTTIPHTATKVEAAFTKVNGATITTFVEEDYFTVYKWDIESRAELVQDGPFTLGSVIEGIGTLITSEGEFALQKGDHFLLPNGVETFEVEGQLSIIASHPNQKGGIQHHVAGTAREMANV